jgi:hypothetical protein
MAEAIHPITAPGGGLDRASIKWGTRNGRIDADF